MLIFGHLKKERRFTNNKSGLSVNLGKRNSFLISTLANQLGTLTEALEEEGCYTYWNHHDKDWNHSGKCIAKGGNVIPQNIGNRHSEHANKAKSGDLSSNIYTCYPPNTCSSAINPDSDVSTNNEITPLQLV